MKRRELLLSAAGVSALGLGIGVGGVVVLTGDDGSSGSKTTSTRVERTVTNVPEKVAAVKPLAEEVTRKIGSRFDARVFITRDGELVMEYTTTAESKNELRTEFNRIASEYSGIVDDGNYDPTTLSIVTGQVQAVVPVSSLRAYLNDEINQDAFLETITVTDIERRTE